MFFILRKANLVLILLSLVAVSPGFSQSERMEVRFFSVEQGLSGRSVFHLFQDHHGFLWISTSYGVNRFDGKEIKEFRHSKFGFSDKGYDEILEDRNGRIWFIFEEPEAQGNNPRNIDVFDPFTQKAVPLSSLYAPPFSLSEIQRIQMQENRMLFFALTGGVIYKFDGKDFVKIRQSPPGNFPLRDFTLIPGTGIALLEDQSLYLADTLGQICATISLPDSIIRVHAGSEGRIWLEQSDSSGIRQPAPNLQKVRLWYIDPDSLPKPFANSEGEPLYFDKHYFFHCSTREDANSRLWVFQNGVLKILDRDGQEQFSAQLKAPLITSNGLAPLGPHESKPHDILFDQDQNVWLGTGGGMWQLSFLKSKFTPYLVDGEMKDSRGIVEDLAGNLYLVAARLHKVDRESGTILDTYTTGVRSAMRDRNGILWFGDYLARIFSFDPATEKIEEFRHPDYTPSGGKVQPLNPYQDPETGQIWVGTESNGLVSLDVDRRELVTYTQYNQFPELARTSVKSFWKNGEGIWLCTSNGLYVLNPDSGIVAHYGTKSGDLLYDNLAHLLVDEQGIFWIGCLGGGLLRWDRKSGVCTQFSISDGLSDNTIYAVYEDEHHFLWLSSNYGLMRFHKYSHQLRTFYPNDGIPNLEFNGGSHFRGRDGRFYFGGIGGFVGFDPDEFVGEAEKAVTFPLQVLAYEKFDGATDEVLDETETFLTHRQISLKPSDRSFSLKFTLPDFGGQGHPWYAYKIEGWQEEWILMQENHLRISGLPPGSYTLRLKAQNTKANGPKNPSAFPYLWRPLSIASSGSWFWLWWYWARLFLEFSNGVRIGWCRKSNGWKRKWPCVQKPLAGKRQHWRRQIQPKTNCSRSLGMISGVHCTAYKGWKSRSITSSKPSKQSG